MATGDIAQLVETLQRVAKPLPPKPDARSYHDLVDDLKTRDYILLGESTHGTAEFYQARIEITKQLVRDNAIAAVAIEGDWPSAWRVNRFVRGQGNDASAVEALGDFKRFPLWMWRNTLVPEFVEWLREHNEKLPRDQRVGFYGLDMYSMYESIAAVLEYLDQMDPDTARHARKVYSCLDHVDGPQTYGYGVSLGRRESCERDVMKLLLEMRERSMVYAKPGDASAEDELFAAERNARLVKSAESYYRQMFKGSSNTWNLRDSHMLETLTDLRTFLTNRRQAPARIVVWAHNSHIGDARATYMVAQHQHNLGQLVRERVHGTRASCALVGFMTSSGTVTAASDWDAAAERKRVRPPLPGSIESVFHDTGLSAFLLPILGEGRSLLDRPLLQRAIGVLYLPQSERRSHYFHADVSRQFDWIIHFDKTSALEPLDPVSEWIEGEEQTYPFGI